ncbi:sensor histidine kinase [Salinispora vitiensis]|uniref:sensor histidine kinase n=1 Tax=Salinispora vitiensis TaxID=999544 RepID=UPI00036CDADF|nr:histidine kinase [Salinispora vitiensis]
MIPAGLNRRDVIVAGTCISGVAILTALGANDNPSHTGWLLGTGTLTGIAAGLTRARPFAGLGLGVVAAVIDMAIGPSLATVVIFSQILHDATVHGPRRLSRLLLWTGALVTVGVTIATMLTYRTASAAVTGVLLAIVLLLPVWSGISIREHRDRSEAERRNAEQVARLAELDNRQAVAAERTRMARELHDVVANHIGIIAIHSTGALSLAEDRHDQRRQALTVIRENAVRGLAELRESINLLRMNDTGAAVGARGIEDVPALIRQVEQAELTVRMATLGRPRSLPAAVEMAAYRIAQESLTNAVKHGAGEADMTIDYQGRQLVITVSNPVRNTVGDDAGTYGARAGLIGMRERALLLGGTFTADVVDDGFRVRVTLPVAETSR